MFFVCFLKKKKKKEKKKKKTERRETRSTHIIFKTPNHEFVFRLHILTVPVFFSLLIVTRGDY